MKTKGKKDRKRRRNNERKNGTKKEKDCFFSFWLFHFISSDLGFQLSTVSSSMNFSSPAKTVVFIRNPCKMINRQIALEQFGSTPDLAMLQIMSS